MKEIWFNQVKWENVHVTNITFGPEDHGILTGFVFVDGSGLHGGFGGLRLGKKGDIPSPAAYHWLAGVCAVLGINDWAQLGYIAKTKKPLVRALSEGLGRSIVAIRPIVDPYPIFAPWDDLDTNPRLYRNHSEAFEAYIPERWRENVH